MHNGLLLISGHEGQLITEELLGVYLEMAGVEAVTAHDEYTSPATPKVLNRRQSSHSSKKHAVFVQSMLIRKQNEELTNEIQYTRTRFSKELSYLRTILNRLTMVLARVPWVNIKFILNSTDVTSSSLPSQSLIPATTTGDDDNQIGTLLLASLEASNIE